MNFSKFQTYNRHALDNARRNVSKVTPRQSTTESRYMLDITMIELHETKFPVPCSTCSVNANLTCSIVIERLHFTFYEIFLVAFQLITSRIE